MASGQTEQFGLNQWSKEDRVLMEDFNSDNAKLDAALGECAHILTGTYVGDGTSRRTFTLGVKPKVLGLWGQGGFMEDFPSPLYIYGGWTLRGLSRSYAFAELTDDGFVVFNSSTGHICTNESNASYNYLVLY